MMSRASIGPSVQTSSERKNIVLVGMMGAGKSAVARRLAKALGARAVDTDDIVEQRAGMTVAQIFETMGEEAFRDAESAAIAELGNVVGAAVVSLGGGSVLREANRAAIRAYGTVVWLRASPATLAARVGAGQGRPLLWSPTVVPEGPLGRLLRDSSPALALSRLAEEREPLYAEVADIAIDVDDLSEEAVVGRVLAEMGSPER